MKKTYEEFRTEWYSKLPGKLPKELELPESVEVELTEYFCQCDYKRYIGEWSTQEL